MNLCSSSWLWMLALGTTMHPTSASSENCTGDDEIELEINATRTGYSAVIDTLAVGGAAVATTWLGGPASFADLAQSAIDFGWSIARLSAEECGPTSIDLQQQLHDLSKKMDESRAKVETGLQASTGNLQRIVKDKMFQLSYGWTYKSQIRNPLKWIYTYATKTLTTSSEHDRDSLMYHCEGEERPEVIIMRMPAFFESPPPKDDSAEDLDINLLLDLVEYERDSETKVRMLMAQIDADARIALMSLGICAQSTNDSESELNELSKRSIQALSKVHEAFKRALQNDTTPSTHAPPTLPKTPLGDDVVGFMNHTARNVLGKEMKETLDSQEWSGREKWHEQIVNGTVNALNNQSIGYVFNALAYLPYDRDDQQCRQFPEDKFVDVGYRNLKLFVLYSENDNARKKQIADEAREKLKNDKDARDAVLNHVFAKSNEDLCGRLTTALKDVNTTAFSGVAAVKCGYEFVWYELGYTYFFAAYSSTKYQWEKRGGAYDAKCGQIFFFP